MADPYATGLYEIVNLTNGKRYIGSGVKCARRFSEHRHRLRGARHHSPPLQSAWIKHGEDAFVFRMFMVCPEDLLLFYEQRALDILKPEYNVNPTAINCSGRVLSAETREKIGAKARGRKRDPALVEAIASQLRGRKLPPERSVHLLGNTHAKGYKHTPEWLAAQAERTRLRSSGVPKTPEHRAKIAESLRGVRHSAERRAKQADAQRGTRFGPRPRRIASKDQKDLFD